MQNRRRPDKNKIGFGLIEHSLGVNEVAWNPVLIRECRQLGLITSVDGCIVHRPPSRPAGITRFRAVPVAAMIAIRASFMHSPREQGRLL
jgi:hypothetical protein